MSLYEQVKCIEEMQNRLIEFSGEVEKSMSDYLSDIKFLRANGLSIEIEEKYIERYYNPANDAIETVLNSIGYQHYPYLEEVKRRLRELI